MFENEKIKAIEKARIEADEKIKTIKRKFEVKQCLYDMGLKNINYNLFIHSLYGSDVSITVEHNFYSYGEEKKQPDYETVLELSRIFKPSAMVKVKDGCLSFRTREHVDSLPEEKKERWSEEIDISPFLIKFSCFQHNTIEFKWFTKLDNGMNADIKVVLNNDRKIGFCHPIYKGNSYNSSLIDTQLKISDKIHVLFDEDGTSTAGRCASPIKWASGGTETPNDFTIYFEDFFADVPATIEDLLRPFVLSLAEKRIELFDNGLMLVDYFQGTNGVLIPLYVNPDMTYKEVFEDLELEINNIWDHIQCTAENHNFPIEFLQKAIDNEVKAAKEKNKDRMNKKAFPDMEFDDSEDAENAVLILTLEFIDNEK